LVAWAGHDLQTPLASIRAILEAVADGVVEDPATLQRYLQTAQRNIRDLSHLIDDLFEVAHLQAGSFRLHLETSSLNDLISDTVEGFSGEITDRGIHLEGRVAPGVDPVLLDPARIGRVLGNLLANAIRHTPDGGQIAIEATGGPAEVRISVRDNGEGIAQEDLPHVFESFYRGEKSRGRASGGSGLGLAIARGFVEAHGGVITAESPPGQGCTVWFTLPRRPPSPDVPSPLIPS
jgi:signal transduction histidine kinase